MPQIGVSVHPLTRDRMKQVAEKEGLSLSQWASRSMSKTMLVYDDESASENVTIRLPIRTFHRLQAAGREHKVSAEEYLRQIVENRFGDL